METNEAEKCAGVVTVVSTAELRLNLLFRFGELTLKDQRARCYPDGAREWMSL